MIGTSRVLIDLQRTNPRRIHKVTPDEVYRLTAQIPRGKVSTYGAIAAALGSRGARAVGQILKRNPTPITVPCHRVVKSDGSLGGYGGVMNSKDKIKLLRREGVPVTNGRIENFKNVLFSSFE